MVSISYNRPVTINPDWGVKNLLEAMEKGDQLKNLTKEDFRISKEISSRTLAPEQIRRAKEKYSSTTCSTRLHACGEDPDA